MDSLTQLANRRTFNDRLTLEISRRKRGGKDFAIAYFDLDGFKAVNDTLGHPKGDEVLVIVAEIMRNTLRASDLPARIGGDEFCALISDVDGEKAMDTVRRQQAGIQNGMASLNVAVTASFGVVTSVLAKDDASSLV